MCQAHNACVLQFDSFRSRLKAFLAGCVLTAISTAALIVWLGLVVPLNTDNITQNAAKTHDQPNEAKAVVRTAFYCRCLCFVFEP